MVTIYRVLRGSHFLLYVADVVKYGGENSVYQPPSRGFSAIMPAASQRGQAVRTEIPNTQAGTEFWDRPDQLLSARNSPATAPQTSTKIPAIRKVGLQSSAFTETVRPGASRRRTKSSAHPALTTSALAIDDRRFLRVPSFHTLQYHFSTRTFSPEAGPQEFPSRLFGTVHMK